MLKYIKADCSYLSKLTQFSAQFFAECWSEASFSSELKKPNSAVFCAVNEDNDICGVICVENQFGDGYLHNIAVKPDYRRQGVGEALISHASAFIKLCGANKMFLEVRVSNNNAINLYKKYGFEIISVRRGFYNDPNEDAYTMVLELQ